MHLKAPSDEISVNDNLKSFLKNNPNPKVILRTPKRLTNTVQGEELSIDYNNIYFVIEKELRSAGFIVRDRGLFDLVASNDDVATTYDKVAETTKTDLIIELIQFDPTVTYKTNRYFRNKELTKEATSLNVFKKDGAKVEFKVIMVKNNEISGTYKFNFSPCENTPCEWMKKGGKGHSSKPEPFTTVEIDPLEEFIKEVTQVLIKTMK